MSSTSSDLHPLQVENCDSNSRLVVEEDGNGNKFSFDVPDPGWGNIIGDPHFLQAWQLLHGELPGELLPGFLPRGVRSRIGGLVLPQLAPVPAALSQGQGAREQHVVCALHAPHSLRPEVPL